MTWIERERRIEARRIAFYDAAKPLAGQPCTPGHTPQRDGCIKKGAAAHVARAGQRKQREIARGAAGAAVIGTKVARPEAKGSVAKGGDLGPLEHARAVRAVAEKSGIKGKAAAAIVDRAQGRKAGDERKRGLVSKGVEGAKRFAAKEYDHYDHELEAAGVGGPDLKGKILRGAVLAGLKVAMSIPGVPSAALGGVGTALGAISYGVGVDMMANVKAYLGGVKLTAKAFNTGAKLLAAHRGKVAA